VRREVNIHLVEGEAGGIKVGDWVLIHVGFAMSRIDEEEANRTLSFIRELGDLYTDELAQFADSNPFVDDVGEAAVEEPVTQP
ncbi:MAG: HypC/HybG/HupF family hydrogenase formation chaperone, partial [Acidimicrobiales bacterium]